MRGRAWWVRLEAMLRILRGVVDLDEYPDVRYVGEARELRDGLSEHVLVLREQLDLDALAAAVSAALDGEHNGVTPTAQKLICGLW